jgi:AraC-like DNA-binding protein/CheY-like chemotaxis protein
MQVENYGGGLKAEIQIPIHPGFEKSILNIDKQSDVPNRPAILLVINHSELRGFLSESFKWEYQVLNCGSAEEAKAVLEKKMPELIVSDYELNGMNGLQFYNQLIANRITNSIPFILLNDEDDPSIKLAALQAGVHSIVIKPFNMEELQAIVRNYFASKKNIKGQLTSDSNSIHLLDVEISNQQKELLDRLLAFMENNYQNSNLNVELLCVELEMSRPQLYRKLQTLTGLSVQEFIKSFRLKKAATFLRSGDQRISDIAYLVGFSDPQHFSKSFKVQFGKSPTQYAAEHRA